MYTTNKSYTLGTTYIPKGATCINTGSFIWKQIMASIRILANEIPNKSQEIKYMLDNKPIYAILDVNDDLYLWGTGTSI